MYAPINVFHCVARTNWHHSLNLSYRHTITYWVLIHAKKILQPCLDFQKHHDYTYIHTYYHELCQKSWGFCLFTTVLVSKSIILHVLLRGIIRSTWFSLLNRTAVIIFNPEAFIIGANLTLKVVETFVFYAVELWEWEFLPPEERANKAKSTTPKLVFNITMTRMTRGRGEKKERNYWRRKLSREFVF